MSFKFYPSCSISKVKHIDKKFLLVDSFNKSEFSFNSYYITVKITYEKCA